MDLFDDNFFTPVTESVFICPICGTMSCIDREFRHGLLEVRRSIIFKLSSEQKQETVKMMSIQGKRV